VAAVTRIGELYQQFYTDMYELPQFDVDECIDDGYPIDDCYDAEGTVADMFYEFMYPIETKSRESFTEALSIAHENGIYTEWTAYVVERMMEVDRSIRVRGEAGVRPSNRGHLYSGSDYIVDLEPYAERRREIQEAWERAHPAPGLPGQPAVPIDEPMDEDEGETTDGLGEDAEAAVSE
jgi:hypothetical protein